VRLLLIRHGQTPGNVLGQLDTAHPGPGLTELGEHQAEALSRALANERIHALYASTLVRTQITGCSAGNRVVARLPRACAGET
jgi:broad specificity phosphatase PhoE